MVIDLIASAKEESLGETINRMMGKKKTTQQIKEENRLRTHYMGLVKEGIITMEEGKERFLSDIKLELGNQQ